MGHLLHQTQRPRRRGPCRRPLSRLAERRESTRSLTLTPTFEIMSEQSVQLPIFPTPERPPRNASTPSVPHREQQSAGLHSTTVEARRSHGYGENATQADAEGLLACLRGSLSPAKPRASASVTQTRISRHVTCRIAMGCQVLCLLAQRSQNRSMHGPLCSLVELLAGPGGLLSSALPTMYHAHSSRGRSSHQAQPGHIQPPACLDACENSTRLAMYMPINPSTLGEDKHTKGGVQARDTIDRGSGLGMETARKTVPKYENLLALKVFGRMARRQTGAAGAPAISLGAPRPATTRAPAHSTRRTRDRSPRHTPDCLGSTGSEEGRSGIQERAPSRRAVDVGLTVRFRAPKKTYKRPPYVGGRSVCQPG